MWGEKHAHVPEGLGGRDSTPCRKQSRWRAELQRLNLSGEQIKRRERISVPDTWRASSQLSTQGDRSSQEIIRRGCFFGGREGGGSGFFFLYRSTKSLENTNWEQHYFIFTGPWAMALSFRRRCLLLLCLTAVHSDAAVQVTALHPKASSKRSKIDYIWEIFLNFIKSNQF